jgi:hypothetical protein
MQRRLTPRSEAARQARLRPKRRNILRDRVGATSTSYQPNVDRARSEALLLGPGFGFRPSPVPLHVALRARRVCLPRTLRRVGTVLDEVARRSSSGESAITRRVHAGLRRLLHRPDRVTSHRKRCENRRRCDERDRQCRCIHVLIVRVEAGAATRSHRERAVIDARRQAAWPERQRWIRAGPSREAGRWAQQTPRGVR